jgi:hypothetical protein
MPRGMNLRDRHLSTLKVVLGRITTAGISVVGCYELIRLFEEGLVRTCSNSIVLSQSQGEGLPEPPSKALEQDFGIMFM